jgi:hypothetical protein
MENYVNIFEMDLGVDPDWEAATDYINDLSEDECSELLEDVYGESHGNIQENRDAILEALNLVKEAWEEDSDRSVKFDGARTTILIAVENNCDNELDASLCKAIELITDPGIAGVLGALLNDEDETDTAIDSGGTEDRGGLKFI